MIEGNQPKFRSIYKLLSVLMFAMLAVQPVLGGWGWFRDRTAIDIHAIVANTMFMVAFIMLVLAVVAGFAQRTLILGGSVLLLLMIVAQMGLGYGGRGRPEITALHIPMGVFTFGVGLLLMMFALGFTLRRESA